MAKQLLLLRDIRFLPLFIVQFLGAFNDNLLKTAIVVLIAYGLWDIGDIRPAVLVSIAAAIFILPFIVFTPLAGALGDKYDKDIVIKWIKLAEIFICIASIAALFTGSLYLSFACLFALGAQSAFFSPCKFSILPQYLNADELIGANGLVSTGTYLAILLGTIIGALIAPLEFGKVYVGGILIVAALVGYMAALYMPKAQSGDPDIVLRMNVFSQIYESVSLTLKSRATGIVCIIGISWFYFVAATFHAQFPNYAAETLRVDNIVLTLFMVIFSFGIAAGGMLNNVILNSRIDARFVPWAAVGITVFALDLYFASQAFSLSSEYWDLVDVPRFVSDLQGIRIMADLFLISMMGGLYIVPLRAYLQNIIAPQNRSRVMSSSVMMDALFILASSLFATFLLARGVVVIDLFLIMAILNIAAALILFKVYPRQDAI